MHLKELLKKTNNYGTSKKKDFKDQKRQEKNAL